MENRAIGICIVALVVVAAVALAIGMATDDGEDSGNPVAYTVEYHIGCSSGGSIYSYEISFDAPAPGSYYVYLNGEPLLNGRGEQIGDSWEYPGEYSQEWGRYIDGDMTLEEFCSGLSLDFPGWNAVRV